jgi:carbamoyl-phosphate synthase large subunit
MKKILVTGAGGTAAINFIRAIRDTGEKIYIVGTDCSKYYIHLAREVNKRFVVPRYSDTDYIKRLNEIIEREDIRFLHAQPDVEVGRISEGIEVLITKFMMYVAEAGI